MSALPTNAREWWFGPKDLNFKSDDNTSLMFAGLNGRPLIFRGQPVQVNPWTPIPSDFQPSPDPTILTFEGSGDINFQNNTNSQVKFFGPA